MNPFRQIDQSPVSEASVLVQARAQHADLGLSLEDAIVTVRNSLQYIRDHQTLWRNDVYEVHVEPIPEKENWPAMIHLSIKRLDRAQIIAGWRDLQDIKNMLVGPDHEAIELYPMESRVLDTANQYHLWALAEPNKRFPLGFNTPRLVTNQSMPQLGHAQTPRAENVG